MKAITLYLGLDVHKDSTTVALAEPGPKGEVRLFGTITSDIDRLEKALGRIRQAHPGANLEVAYEASPCGIVSAGVTHSFVHSWPEKMRKKPTMGTLLLMGDPISDPHSRLARRIRFLGAAPTRSRQWSVIWKHGAGSSGGRKDRR